MIGNKQYFVYILASKRNGTLYTGFSNGVIKRTWEHKHDVVEGFTKKYNVHRLVYYDLFDEALAAIAREKQIKKWKRRWKLTLIEKKNPPWKDLYDELG